MAALGSFLANWSMELLTAVMAVFTAFMWRVAALQHQTLEKQSELLASANEHNRVVERAYVYVRDVVTFAAFEVGKSPGFSVLVVNSGRTPARVTSVAAATVIPYDLTHLPRPMPRLGNEIGPFVMVAGQESEFGFVTHSPNSQQFSAVIVDGRPLVVFGRLEYLDAFEKPHFTEFSFTWDPKASAERTESVFNLTAGGYADAN